MKKKSLYFESDFKFDSTSSKSSFPPFPTKSKLWVISCGSIISVPFRKKGRQCILIDLAWIYAKTNRHLAPKIKFLTNSGGINKCSWGRVQNTDTKIISHTKLGGGRAAKQSDWRMYWSCRKGGAPSQESWSISLANSLNLCVCVCTYGETYCTVHTQNTHVCVCAHAATLTLRTAGCMTCQKKTNVCVSKRLPRVTGGGSGGVWRYHNTRSLYRWVKSHLWAGDSPRLTERCQPWRSESFKNQLREW